MSTIQSLFDLSGRTALISGASRGIGHALAQGLSAAGCNLVVAGRDVDALAPLCQSIRSAGRQCHAEHVDVGNVSSIEALFSSLEAQGIHADILINNAGMEQVCDSVDVDEALWDRICDTNLKGAFFMAQHFARALFARGGSGSIINMGSLTSAVGVPTATPYTSSKSGLMGMTRALSTEWSPHGIRVNAMGPGYFRTALTDQFYEDEQWQTAMLSKIPMQRFGQLEDLIGICVFLAGDASAYVTGQILYVDGGYLASI